MTKGLLLGAGLGAAAMFFLDPDRGKRRRTLLTDKVTRLGRMTAECIDATTRDLTNRTRGFISEIKSVFSSEQPDDSVLVDRVRAKLGRMVSHPSAITVMAQNGAVTLTGPVLADEVPHLLSSVKWIAGVQHVNNDLEIHEEAENHPALQGGREHTDVASQASRQLHLGGSSYGSTYPTA